MSALHGADAATSLAAWLDALRAAGGLEPLGVEDVPLDRAVGRVTAAAVVARRSSPGFDAAAMDGIALAAADAAGAPATLPPSRFAPVDTGDPLPAGHDAVVRHEDVLAGAGGHVSLTGPVLPYANVRQIGEDVAAGDLLARPGRVVRPTDIAVLASAGETSVIVRRRPVVAIVPTGDELVPVGQEPGPGQLVDTNSLMLAAMVEQEGAVARQLSIVPDEPAVLAEAIAGAAAGADLVLLLSGSAKGADDHTVAALERVGQVVVQGVALKPGHPTVLGLTGTTPVIGVPGYPISANLAFEQFAAPLLAMVHGRIPAERARVRARVAATIRSSPANAEWVRIRLASLAGELVAIPLRRGAGVLTSLSRADALACIPLGLEGVVSGEEIEVELLRPLVAIERTIVLTGATAPLADTLAALAGVVPDCEGSALGAAALAAGCCHAALLERNDVPADAVELRTWTRELGLVVATGNPLAITGVGDLARADVRLANRPQGSSSRRLLDDLLERDGVDPEVVRGYRRESRSHNAVAAAVAGGVADCGIAVASAAAVHGLDLVPLATVELVLVTTPGLATDPRIVHLRDDVA